MNDFETKLQKAINTVLSVNRDCIVHNFNLIKIELPSDLYDELVKRCSCVLIKKETDYTSYIGTYMGFPVERKEGIFSPRYVIEGDLELL